MFLWIARKIYEIFLISKLTWRNIECRYFARYARKHPDSIDELAKCILEEFLSRDSSASYIEWHSQLGLGYATRKNGERFSDICWEAPICLTIFSNGSPLVGMAIEFRGAALCIRQLQGVSGAIIPLTLRKWPALFVCAAKKFLLQTKNIHSLRLYAADQRASYKYPLGVDESDLRAYRQNLRRRYDGTARQQKFKKKNSKYWEWTP